MPVGVLLDQGAPRRAVQALREAGVDAVHVGERGMARASDQEILDLARREARCVVTFDHDFGSLLAHSGATAPSVIFIRRSVPTAQFHSFIVELLTAHAEPIATGVILSVGSDAVRSRPLPLTTSTRNRESKP